MNKVDLVKEAIAKALRRESKLSGEAWNVPALSSLNIRHLMNNLGAISTRYWDCGVHVGGLFCSTIWENDNLKSATANDNFQSDETGDIKYEPQFLANVSKCLSENTSFKLIKRDTFDVKPEEIVGPIDLYLFDADHSYNSQYKAISAFLSAMADEFILCVDDYDWKEVYEATQAGIKDAGLEILFEETWKGNDHDNEGAWNGYHIALLKKKS